MSSIAELTELPSSLSPALSGIYGGCPNLSPPPPLLSLELQARAVFGVVSFSLLSPKARNVLIYLKPLQCRAWMPLFEDPGLRRPTLQKK